MVAWMEPAVEAVLAPVAAGVIEVDANADEGCRDEDVQSDRTDDAAAELIVGGEGRDGLGGHSYAAQ